MHERMYGPLSGYFVAAYACEVGEFGRQYVGYFKICGSEPTTYWDAECLIKGCDQSAHDDPDSALEAALQAALDSIGNLPPANLLAALRERRPLYSYELMDLGLLGKAA